ncbi:MAG TPA: Rieske 2Fe-2S domain-containing protein [Acidimicrobiales bacterium]|nr:Rieske 2Fe-2S domain-containing protein [Acidimicrobiales bacterium]
MTEPSTDRTVPVRDRARAENAARIASVAFAVSALASLGLTVVYWRGGQPQLEGVLLAIAFAGLGGGLIVWAHRILSTGEHEEAREPLPSTASDREAVEVAFERGGVFERRTFLMRMLAVAGGALGVAMVFPIRSLGPRPAGSLAHTPWTRGRRLITADGRPVLASAVPDGGLVTVFPEGSPGSADGQAVLIRVDPARLASTGERAGWTPDGLIAYSKVCTHAGCPVGLYEAQSHQLLCPCHQSAFDVLAQAKPVVGPAARPLPQLPLDIDGDGYLIATGDFSEPIGPAYWERS